MANYQKHTRTAVGHLGKHYERGKDETSQYIKFGNQSIRPELTHLNYNLAPERNMGHVEFVNQRTSEVQCLNRKDVNVMCSWVVTMPKGFPPEQEKEFFEQTYKFLENRYGGEKNVVSAYVHKDENQPHIHFAFVPVVKDKKKGHDKVSAKECVDKKDLLTFHKDLSKHMERYFGRDVGLLNEATREGNKSIEELKRQSAADRLQEVKEKSKDIMSQTHSMFEKAKEKAEILNKEIEKGSERLKRLLEKEKDIEDKISRIDKIEAKKGLFGSYTMKEKDYMDLVALAKHGARVNDLENKLEKVSKDYDELKSKYTKENSLEKAMDKAKEQSYKKPRKRKCKAKRFYIQRRLV